LLPVAIHATILAGGAGTRLWPRSRRGQPKHLLALQQGEAPLLRQTYERIRPLVDEVHVVTERHQRERILEVLPELGGDNVIVEPVARGTTSALGLAAMILAEKDPAAVMLSLPADHIVGDNRRFKQTIRRVVRLAALSSQLVTVGLTPYYPATGFGYIRTNGQVRFGRTTGLHVLEFIEKPSFERAVGFVDGGGYYWNLAMFSWRVDTLISELARLSPAHHEILGRVLELRREGDTANADALYGELPKEAIDYSVMEKTDRLLLIPARFHWIDVGSWSELHAILPKDVSGNVVNGDHVLIDSESSLFDVPGKFVAAIGVKDLVVVESGDALLICQKSRAQDVKVLVEQLRAGQFGVYA
jgi:mannose-1-phosphate guanylyltransferase